MSEKSKKSNKDSLLRALRMGQADKVTRFIKSDPDLGPDTEADSAQNCLLHRAARFGHLNVVKALLDCKADPNKTNKFGMTPLHHAAVAGEAKITETLVKAGSNPRIVDDSGRSPLHWACAYAFVDVAKVLLDHGAKAELQDKEGFTPLHRVSQEKPPQTKKKKEDQDNDDENVEDQVAEMSLEEEDEKRAKIAEMLIQKGAKLSTTEHKGLQTPLHLCAMNGYAKTGQVLIQKGKANVNIQNKIFQTPLMYACIEQHQPLVEVMLKYGNPDFKVENRLHWNWTALHWAVLQDNVAIVKALIKGGADPDAKDSVGRNAAKLADEHFKDNVVEYLKTI